MHKKFTHRLKLSRYLSLLLAILLSNSLCARENFQELLQKIDISIKNSEIYTHQREERIEKLKESRRYVKAFSEQEYIINSKLFGEYKSYICDSAIHYQNLNIQIGGYLHDVYKEYESKIKLAFLLGSSGMYKESLDMLETINRTKLPESLKLNYLYTYLHVYNELAFYTQDKQSSQRYWNLSAKINEELHGIIQKDKMLALQLKEDSARDAHNYDMALRLNDIWLSSIKEETP